MDKMLFLLHKDSELADTPDFITLCLEIEFPEWQLITQSEIMLLVEHPDFELIARRLAAVADYDLWFMLRIPTNYKVHRLLAIEQRRRRQRYTS